MSLRDSFLKAGLDSKKDLNRVENQLKKEARVAQGNQESKAYRERQAHEAQEAERAAREAELLARRKEAEARAAAELVLMRSRQLMRAHRIQFRLGPQKFWFKAPTPPEVWRLDLPERLAHDIRCGYAGIVWCDDGSPEVLVVSRIALEKLSGFRCEVILFWNKDGADPDVSERLLPSGL
jgi:uncharacterized protein YaiL (DUF2058 family)